MRRFWQGLLWGGIIGGIFAAILRPMTTPRKKPFTERSVAAIKMTTQDLMQKARKTRRRVMKKLD